MASHVDERIHASLRVNPTVGLAALAGGKSLTSPRTNHAPTFSAPPLTKQALTIMIPNVAENNSPIACQGNLEMSHREQLRNVILVTFLRARWGSCV